MSQPSAEPEFQVFLSHCNKDKDEVRALRDRLVAEDITVWFDEDELRPGIPWQRLLEDGIQKSASIAVVVGAHGIGPWENEEMRAALQFAVDDKERIRPVIPVLLHQDHAPALPLFLRSRTWVNLGDEKNPGKAFDNLVWGITGRKRGRPSAARAHDPSAPVAGTVAFSTTPAPRTPAAEPPPLPVAPPPPAPPPAPLSLEALLPGSWQVRIQTPFALGNLQLVLTAQGSFRGELLTPMGPSIVDGQWQANTPARQITLQGRQAAGFQVMPYYALVQVTFFDAQQIVGLTAAGEQVTWHKQTPAA